MSSPTSHIFLISNSQDKTLFCYISIFGRGLIYHREFFLQKLLGKRAKVSNLNYSCRIKYRLISNLGLPIASVLNKFNKKALLYYRPNFNCSLTILRSVCLRRNLEKRDFFGMLKNFECFMSFNWHPVPQFTLKKKRIIAMELGCISGWFLLQWRSFSTDIVLQTKFKKWAFFHFFRWNFSPSHWRQVTGRTIFRSSTRGGIN